MSVLWYRYPSGSSASTSISLVGWIGSLVRLLQTGYIYHYALVMLVGVFALMTWFVWLHR